MFRIIKGYLSLASIAGLRFIVDQEIHFLERLFWIICVALSWFASVLLILASWDAYKNNSISFVSDTAYLDFETNFPTVIFCEEPSSYTEKITDIFSTDENYKQEVLTEIGFFKGSAANLKSVCRRPKNNESCSLSLTFIATVVRHNCSTLLNYCTWNDVPFDCCSHFKQLNTELGPCYAINSLQTRNTSDTFLNMMSVINGPLGKLHFKFKTKADVYVLSREEIPSFQTGSFTVEEGQHKYLYVNVNEIKNDEAVKTVDVDLRKCRYLDENDLTVQNHYSFNGCIVETRKQLEMKYCNCTHHWMPNSDTPCDRLQLMCIVGKWPDVSVMKPVWSEKRGFSVQCYPNCQEMEIKINERDFILNNSTEFGFVTVQLNELPSQRFMRKMIHGKLDLVVSVGGAVGLFVGASILSFVEFFYYFGLRAWTPSKQYYTPIQRAQIDYNEAIY